MRVRLRALSLLSLAAVLGFVVPGRSAQGDEEVVAKVADQTITRGELEARMARVPRVQLAQLGKDSAEIRKGFLEKVLIPEVLFALGARARIEKERDVQLKVKDVYRKAMIDSVRAEVEKTGVTSEDVAKFYADNRDRFQSPERIQVWRILVRTEADARAVIDEVKKPGGDKKWTELARDRSLDKATNERSGNVGFIAENGSSSEVTVKVDPVLFTAAKKAKDGELVEAPVKEGDGFAVVWRRGSTPPVMRTLEQEGGTIRQVLAKQKVETRMKELLGKLRTDLVKDEAPSLLAMVEVGSSGDVAAKKRPGIVTPKATGKPQPSSTPRGLR